MTFLTKHSLKLIYFTLVHSHLLYGLFVWGNSKFSNKNRLVTLQKKAIRIVNGSSYLAHTEPIFKNLKILKLSDLYIMQGIKHFCSITEGNSPNYISNNVKVNSEIHKYHTRQSQNIFKESIQTKIQEQSLNFKLDHSWNMLPHMIQELVKKYSKSKFLMTVKKHFLDSYTTNCNVKKCYSCKKSN